MNIDDQKQCGPSVLTGAGCAQGQCAPSPQSLLRDRARSLRAEANRLEILADALPGRMPALANDALFEIILRRPIF